MPPDVFEALLRHELRERDAKRRLRLGDPVAYAAADQECVNAVMEAAGYGEPDEAAEKPVRRGRRAARANEERAFGEVS